MIKKNISLIYSIQSELGHWSSLSSNRKIFHATLTIALITAFVKVVTLAKELLVAYYFGRSDVLDAFVMAFALSSFAINMVAGSIEVALVPEFVHAREHQDHAIVAQLVTNVMAVFLLLLVIISLLIIVGMPFFLPYIAHGFNRDKLELTRQLTYFLIPTIILSGAGYLWKAVLNAGERFALPAVLLIVTPLVTIVFLLVAADWGIYTLIVGTVLGTVLEVALLAWVMQRHQWRLLPSWEGITQQTRQVMKQYFPVMAGAVFMSGNQLVDQSMAAALAPGSVAALSYGMKLISFPLFLIVIALGTAVLPYASKMVAQQDWISVHHTLNRYLWLIFICTIPITLGLIVFSEPIVRIIFQRGMFTTEDTQIVARIQAAYSLQIPFYVTGILVVRLISSIQANTILMWVSAVNLITNIVLDYLFMHWFGVVGIALSTSLVYLMSFIYCWVLFSRRLSILEKDSGNC